MSHVYKLYRDFDPKFPKSPVSSQITGSATDGYTFCQIDPVSNLGSEGMTTKHATLSAALEAAAQLGYEEIT